MHHDVAAVGGWRWADLRASSSFTVSKSGTRLMLGSVDRVRERGGGGGEGRRAEGELGRSLLFVTDPPPTLSPRPCLFIFSPASCGQRTHARTHARTHTHTHTRIPCSTFSVPRHARTHRHTHMHACTRAHTHHHIHPPYSCGIRIPVSPQSVLIKTVSRGCGE